MNTRIISDAYFGNFPVKYLYQGSELVWPFTPEHPEKPDIRLEYISNGTARTQPRVYFDTLFGTTNSTQVQIKYSYHSAVNNTALFGTFNGRKEYTFMLRGATFQYPSTYYQTTFFYGMIYNEFPSSSTPGTWNGLELGRPAVDTMHTYRIVGRPTNNTSANNGVSAIDDTGVRYYYNPRGVSGASSDFTRDLKSIYLFAAHDSSNNVPTRFAPADTRIYAMAIYDSAQSNVMMYRLFIPVLHYDRDKREYIPCLYDKVSNTYFYNLGTDPVGYKIYEPQGRQDYVLDYIERDETGYLQYMTNVDVSTHLNINVGFTVGNRSVSMTSLAQNVVVGSRYSPNSKYGLFFPYADGTTSFGIIGLGGNILANYDQDGHIHYDHHCDHISFYHSQGAAGTGRGANVNMKWLEFSNSIIPDASTALKFNGQYGSFTEVDSSVVGTPIGILSGGTVHSQVTTRIYYVDISKYSNASVNSVNYGIQTPLCTYIPMIHNRKYCLIDVFTDQAIYNQGPGTPKYMELG